MKKLTSKLLHRKLAIYLLAALFLYPQISYAISENQQQNIINQQNQIIQNQQHKIEQGVDWINRPQSTALL